MFLEGYNHCKYYSGDIWEYINNVYILYINKYYIYIIYILLKKDISNIPRRCNYWLTEA